MEEFPPNSMKWKAEQRAAAEKQQVKRVTTARTRHKSTFGRNFSYVFFGGDAREAFGYTFTHTVIPTLQELFLDSVNSWMQRKVYGDRGGPRRYRPGGPLAGSGSFMPAPTPYNRMSTSRPDDRPPMPRMLSRTSRQRHNFDEIIINSRPEAEEVLDNMYTMLQQYESVSVADLYALTGIESSHTDQKWGWTDLRGAAVGRARGGGYVLELPDPEYFQ